jgi:hypothetical protein
MTACAFAAAALLTACGGGGTTPGTDSNTSAVSGATGTCTAAPCINFGESNLGMVDFGRLGIEVANDPADASNKVAKLTKATDDEPWAGVTVHLGGTGNSVTRIDPAQGITLRVYSPAAGLPIMVKIENASNADAFVEATASTTKAGEWETLTFTYAAANTATTYNKVSVFPGFNTQFNEVYYIDELKYTAKAADSGSSNATGPTAAALAPTANAANVVSIFSDAYTNIAVNEWGPNWGASSARVSDGAVAGDNFKSIDMTAAGQEFGAASFTDSKFDATSYTHFNMDYWLDAPLLAGQVVTIKLSNHDGGAETSAVDFEVLPVVGGSWQRLAIPLSSFKIAGGASASRNNIAQLVITAPRTNNGLPLKMYIDNVYFSK